MWLAHKIWHINAPIPIRIIFDPLNGGVQGPIICASNGENTQDAIAARITTERSQFPFGAHVIRSDCPHCLLRWQSAVATSRSAAIVSAYVLFFSRAASDFVKLNRADRTRIRPIFKIKQMSKQNTVINDSVVVLSIPVYLDICQLTETPHTHTHTHTHRARERESSIFDEKGADEQRSLLIGVEKCASGVNSEVPAQTGNDASRRFCPWCVSGVRVKLRCRFVLWSSFHLMLHLSWSWC